MSRKEENRELIKILHDKALEKPDGSFEEMVVFNLGMIASVLVDMSKSLAILADKAESEGKECVK